MTEARSRATATVLRLPAAGPGPGAEEGRRGLLGRPGRPPPTCAPPPPSCAATTWRQLRDAGLDEVPVNDFSLLRPRARHRRHARRDPRPAPRPRSPADAAGPATSPWRAAPPDVAPLEMTKWFDTNYHYLVPGARARTPRSRSTRPSRWPSSPRRSRSALRARPVLVGPVTFLLLAKPAAGAPADFDPLDLLDRLLPLYAELLAAAAPRPARSGCSSTSRRWSGPTPPAELAAAARAPTASSAALADRPEAPGRDVLRPARRRAAGAGRTRRSRASRSTSPAGRRATWTDSPPPAGCRASGWSPASSTAATSGAPTSSASLATLGTLLGPGRPGRRSRRPARCCTCRSTLAAGDATSTRRSARWLAFARQKVDEVVTLATGPAPRAPSAVAGELAANRAAGLPRRLADHARPGRPGPGRRRHRRRRTAAAAVRRAGRGAAGPRSACPPLPTTTIGSFPQTAELRRARADAAGRADRRGRVRRARCGPRSPR